MAQFEKAYQRTARYEGAYQKMPEDSGNYNSLGMLVGTNWGINAKVYEAYIGRPPGEGEMRNMKKAVAKDIYKKGYWNKMQGDQINSQALAEILYDGMVNHGYWGIKMLQRILGLTEDGIVGPNTLNKINTTDPADLYLKYKAARTAFYHWLAENRTGQQRFLNGWLNRINQFKDYSLQTIKEHPGSSAAVIGLVLMTILFFKKGSRV